MRQIGEGVPDAPGSIAEAIARLLEELEKLKALVRKKVVTGDDTSAARRQQAEIERRIAELRRAAAAEADAERRALAEKVATTAEMVAGAAVRAISDRLLALTIPAKPKRPQ